jgi:hypothetical protein
MKIRSIFKAVLDKYMNKRTELATGDQHSLIKNLHQPAKVIYMYKTANAALKK